MCNKKRQYLLRESKKVLKKAKNKNEELIQENMAIYEENKELRNENEKQLDIIKQIYKISTNNTYNNEKVILRKIKEVINDGKFKQ